MKKIALGTLLLFSCYLLGAQTLSRQKQGVGGAQTLSRPKLVVGIVVDQMRWDYLYRYYDKYGVGGFRRLLNEGFSCENTLISHLPSYTAVGHSTIFTGSVPAIHGITGNSWMDQQTGRTWYCTEDTTVETVGSTDAEGRMSPRNLLASTVTDELRLATNFHSKVVGVSLKDRAAILPAGHAANGAFWFDDSTGNFITSTYYMQELPEWVKRFNEKKEPEKLMSGPWNTLYPIGTYTESTPDEEAWEGKFPGEQTTSFPHDLPAIYKRSKESLRPTPFGNTLILDFAMKAIEGYELGAGGATDFLTINCASTDYVGHQFGPNSIEIEDTYLRLDKDLAAFFTYLDQRVGKGNYLLFLTADHGAAHAIDFSKEHKIPSDFFQSGKLVADVNQFLERQFGVEKLVKSGMNYHLNFDGEKIRSNKLDEDVIKEAAIAFLQRRPGVQFVVDVDHIGEASVPEPIKTMIINGYNKKRCGSVMIIPEPGVFDSYATGTTHGAWNLYDIHIPLVFMGWHITHGASTQTVHMTDIAPTVAALLHIQMPNGCVGEPIEKVIGR